MATIDLTRTRKTYSFYRANPVEGRVTQTGKVVNLTRTKKVYPFFRSTPVVGTVRR